MLSGKIKHETDMENSHGHSGMAGRSVFNTTKIKMIMKSSPEAGAVSQEAAFLIAKATEAFLTAFAQEALHKSEGSHIEYDNVCDAVEDEESYQFLKSIIPRTLPYPDAEAIYYAKGESDARVKAHFGVDPVRDADPNERYPGVDDLFSESDSNSVEAIEEVTFSEENRRLWADVRNPYPPDPAAMADAHHDAADHRRTGPKPRLKKLKHKSKIKYAYTGPHPKLKATSASPRARAPHSPREAAKVLSSPAGVRPEPVSPASSQPKRAWSSASSHHAGPARPRLKPMPQLKPQLQSLLLGGTENALEKSVDVVTVD